MRAEAQRETGLSRRAGALYHLRMFADLRATDVLAAAERIGSTVRRTRLVRSETLSEVAGGDVYLKLENE